MSYVNCLALAEELLVAAQAAVEGMAPRVDDLRVRQDQVDQADVREIVGQLVREARPVGERKLRASSRYCLP